MKLREDFKLESPFNTPALDNKGMPNVTASTPLAAPPKRKRFPDRTKLYTKVVHVGLTEKQYDMLVKVAEFNGVSHPTLMRIAFQRLLNELS